MRVLVASSNSHKLEEIAAVFAKQRTLTEEALDTLNCLTGAGAHEQLPTLELVTLKSQGLTVPEPEEDQLTFEGNAKLKARYYANASGLPTIADDSGLEVDALEGEPGIYSARYSGAAGPRAQVDQANNALLLKNLLGIEPQKRTAHFVCAMALALPDTPDNAPIVVVRGSVPGQIIGEGQSPRGENGFGYDPLFFLPQFNKTMAELAPEEKNALSHRGQAARLLWKKLPDVFDGD